MLITSWAMKVKKKAMKLKELSVLQEKVQSLLHLHPTALQGKGDAPMYQTSLWFSRRVMERKIKGKGETCKRLEVVKGHLVRPPDPPYGSVSWA